jgi:hypothetical protein
VVKEAPSLLHGIGDDEVHVVLLPLDPLLRREGVPAGQALGLRGHRDVVHLARIV